MSEQRIHDDVPPSECPSCGAALQIHDGYHRPYRRLGWYVFGECGSRWHPEHGFSATRLCKTRRELAEYRESVQALIEAAGEQEKAFRALEACPRADMYGPVHFALWAAENATMTAVVTTFRALPEKVRGGA